MDGSPLRPTTKLELAMTRFFMKGEPQVMENSGEGRRRPIPHYAKGRKWRSGRYPTSGRHDNKHEIKKKARSTPQDIGHLSCGMSIVFAIWGDQEGEGRGDVYATPEGPLQGLCREITACSTGLTTTSEPWERPGQLNSFNCYALLVLPDLWMGRRCPVLTIQMFANEIVTRGIAMCAIEWESPGCCAAETEMSNSERA